MLRRIEIEVRLNVNASTVVVNAYETPSPHRASAAGTDAFHGPYPSSSFRNTFLLRYYSLPLPLSLTSKRPRRVTSSSSPLPQSFNTFPSLTSSNARHQHEQEAAISRVTSRIIPDITGVAMVTRSSHSLILANSTC